MKEGLGGREHTKVLLGSACCGVPSPGASLFLVTVECTLHSAPAHLLAPQRKMPGLRGPVEWRTPNPQSGPPLMQAIARLDLVLWAQATEVWGVLRQEGQAAAGPGPPVPRTGPPLCSLPGSVCPSQWAWPRAHGFPPFFSGLQVAPASQLISPPNSGHILRAQ